MRNIFILMFSVFLSACSVFSPVKPTPQTTYEINTLPTISVKSNKQLGPLMVAEPDANPAYATHLMAYTNQRYQVGYFVQHSWAQTPAAMLQNLMVQSLQATRVFKAVLTPTFAGRYHYILSTQLIELQQDFSVRPSVIHLVMRAQLINAYTNQIIATKQFRLTQPAPQDSPYGGVIAANRAAARLMDELTRFCVQAI